jgi:DNA-binding MarR family transcriptional regulator
MSRPHRHVELWRRVPASDRRAWSGLLRVYRCIVPRLDGELEREHRLSLSAYDVLVQVSSADSGLRMGQLADEVLLSPSGLTRLVDRLVDAGLVERRRGETDVRQTYVSITEQGLDLVADATATHLRAVHALFLDRLDPDEKRILAKAFTRILEADGDRRAPARKTRVST